MKSGIITRIYFIVTENTTSVLEKLIRRIDLPMATKNDKSSIEEDKVREYINNVYKKVQQRNPHEEEFQQAVKILFDALIPVLVKHPTYMTNNILERIVEPERLITFQVPWRSEEHTSELQSRGHLVCRLLLEKKK